MSASCSLQCRPELLLVEFENLVHSIFGNINSSLEINLSHFGVLHWQQWQPPASAPEKQANIFKMVKGFYEIRVL